MTKCSSDVTYCSSDVTLYSFVSMFSPFLMFSQFFTLCKSFIQRFLISYILSHIRIKTLKFANLISKLNFYKLIPYPMDNSLSGRRGPARQTTEKVILYACILAGRPWCALARWRIGIASCLDRMTSWHLFRCLN